MQAISIPPLQERTLVDTYRHIALTAVKRDVGEIAELSQDVSKEIVELLILPDKGDTFSEHVLASAGINGLSLTSHCRADKLVRERIWQKMKLFLALHPSDAEWHFERKPQGQGTIISVIVGHPSAMKIARDHGFLHEEEVRTEAVEQNVRNFAFQAQS